MSKVVIQGDASGTGIFTVKSPNSNTDRTLTLPDEAGTVLTSASTTVLPKGVPAFSVYTSADQSFSQSTYTKVTFDTEQFDTNSNFASSRFTPTVAGYYLFNASIFISYLTSAPNTIRTILYKNGSAYRSGYLASAGGASSGPYGALQVSDIVYLNGSTDYVEVYVWSNGVGAYVQDSNDSIITTFFSGMLVRAD